MIRNRAARTGDGSRHDSKVKVDDNNNDHADSKELNHCDLWGWGNWCAIEDAHAFHLYKFSTLSDDKEMTQDDKKYVKILYKRYDWSLFNLHSKRKLE